MTITVNSNDTVTILTNRDAFVIQDTTLPTCNLNTPKKNIQLSSCSVNITVSPTPEISESPLVISIPAGESIQRGQPIYISDIGTAILASQSGYKSDGLATIDTLQNGNVPYVSEGHITKQDWFSITGMETLIPGKIYYLGNNGMLTTIHPESGIAQSMGTAVSTTTLDVQLGVPIKLA